MQFFKVDFGEPCFQHIYRFESKHWNKNIQRSLFVLLINPHCEIMPSSSQLTVINLDKIYNSWKRCCSWATLHQFNTRLNLIPIIMYWPVNREIKQIEMDSIGCRNAFTCLSSCLFHDLSQKSLIYFHTLQCSSRKRIFIFIQLNELHNQTVLFYFQSQT